MLLSPRKMTVKTGALCMLIFTYVLLTSGQIQDIVYLKALMGYLENTPPNWVGSDPCSGNWDGITCTDSRVTSITLASTGLSGELTGDIGQLSELQTLDLSFNKGLTGSLTQDIGNLKKLSSLILVGCGFYGHLPGTLGSLTQLTYLALNSNSFTGPIPASIGNLSRLYWLDLADNKLSGPIPVSEGATPGLDLLVNTKHLLLSNNYFNGPLPNLTGMTTLRNLDLSDNSFEPSEIPPWLSSLRSLKTLRMQYTGLRGQVPVDLFSIPQIETMVLRNNELNGTLDLGNAYSKSLRFIDMTNNLITGCTQRSGYSPDLILKSNPICRESDTTASYCDPFIDSNSSYSTPSDKCIPGTCTSDQVSSPTCKCSYPYKGILYFRYSALFYLENSTIYTSLQSSMMVSFQFNQLPVDTVALSQPSKNSDDYLLINLYIFPYGAERFNRSGISQIGFVLSNQTYKPPDNFGPYFFIGHKYDFFADARNGKHKSISIGMIAGIVVGGSVLVVLLIVAGLYACCQKGRAKRATKKNTPFASWDPDKGGGDCPQLKGVRPFTFEELRTCTNNFSATVTVGSGGYGMVYRGTLPNGQLVAIKRAQLRSTQGGLEFKTEIELLSRVHHKNVVGLVGFCFDAGEQMLVYEYIVNGTLKDSLSGRSGRLDWMTRLKIILGAARGLQYLHDLADPPIIHRDVKTTNILLDERLNAKVADFGISKSLGDADRTHITTQVKGTMGYMDPEYYMTEQLTEKSDVYSFGIVMLELITARNPIDKGKYIVREVKEAMDREKDFYNLCEVLDPTIGPTNELLGLERFVDISLRCVEDTVNQRPRMSEVVKEIESIMELAGFNPNAESASTSETYQGKSKGSGHPYLDQSPFSYSGGLLDSKGS